MAPSMPSWLRLPHDLLPLRQGFLDPALEIEPDAAVPGREGIVGPQVERGLQLGPCVSEAAGPEQHLPELDVRERRHGVRFHGPLHLLLGLLQTARGHEVVGDAEGVHVGRGRRELQRPIEVRGGAAPVEILPGSVRAGGA
jgi:hypothetical protein